MRPASITLTVLLVLPCPAAGQGAAARDARAARLERADAVRDAREARAIGDRRLLGIGGLRGRRYYLLPGVTDRRDTLPDAVFGFGDRMLVDFADPDSVLTPSERRLQLAARAYAERYNRELLRDMLRAPAMRTPEIHGVYREGFYSPNAPMPGVRVAVRFTATARCDDTMGEETRTDSLGAFRLAPQERPASSGDTAMPAATRDWWLCIAPPFSSDGPLWRLYRVPAPPPAIVYIDCRAHGEAGGLECDAVPTLPRTQRR